MNRRRGVTLIELLVVIAIIAILMAGLVVYLKGSVESASRAATLGVITSLSTQCEAYRVEFNCYPQPDGPVLTTPVMVDTKWLHHRLGAKSKKVTMWNSDNTPASVVDRDPFLAFKKEWLLTPTGDPATFGTASKVVDQFGNKAAGELKYKVPGTKNPNSFDLWSVGKDKLDGAGSTAGPGKDDVWP